MDNMKRFVSMLLCLVMVLGFMPVSAVAADASETPLDAAVIFSDLHIGTDTSQNNSKQTLVKNVLTAIKNDYPNVSTVNSAGDMFSSNESNITSNASTVTGWVQSVFDVPVNYVWSDHDRAADEISKESRLVYGAGADNTYGTSDDGNYYVYLLSMADLSSWDRYSAGFYSEAQISQHIEAFKTAAAGLDEGKPLFIVGHQPLFDNRGDNGHAYKWVMAINEIAAERDVTYFFGHNHKYDNISGKPNDYYYPVGATMSVPTTTVLSGSGYSTDLKAVDVELEFTHVCAGYMNPETTKSYNSSTTRLGTAVAAVIYDDHIEYIAYDKDGIYDSNASMVLNESVERKNPVSSEPEVTVEPVADSHGTGITVAAPGVTNVTVEVLEPEYDTEIYTAYASYDIRLDGYTKGEKAIVTIPAPEGFDPARAVQVLFDGQVIATTNIVGGKITFTTDHFSVYDLAQTASVAAGDTMNGFVLVTPTVADDVTTYTSGWVTFQEYIDAVPEVPASSKIKYVLDTDGVDEGTNYLIVNTKNNGTAYALKHEVKNSAHSYGSYEVTIEDGEILLADGTIVNWVFGNKDSYLWTYDTYSVSNQGSYLYPNNGSLTMATSRTNLIVRNQDSGAYRLSRTANLLNTSFAWVNYRNGAWTGSQGSSSAITAVYLFAEAGTVEVPGTPGSEAVPGLYGCMEGALRYEVEAGTSAEAAVQAVKDGITIKYATMPDYSDTAVCDDNAEGVTWTMEPGYNGTPGDYAVTIAYNGVTLGVVEVEIPVVTAYYGAVGPNTCTVEMGTSAGAALSTVKEAVTIYSATDDQGSNAVAVDDSKVTWEWVDTYDAYKKGPYTVKISCNGEELGTVEVEVNVSYGDEDESNSVTVGGQITTKKTVYVLTTQPVAGESYLIVNGNSAGNYQALTNNNGSVASTGVTVKTDSSIGTYIELENATEELWAVESGLTFENDGDYLGYTTSGGWRPSYTFGLSSSARSWSYSNNRLSTSVSSSTYYLRYNSGWTWTNSTNASGRSVYFYIPTEIEVTEDGSATYTMRASDLEHNLVRDNNTAKLDYSLLADGVDATILPGGVEGYDFNKNIIDKNNIIESISDDGTITFTGNTGSAQVRVSYTWTDDEGNDHEVYKYVTVTTKAPNNYPEYPNEGAVKVGKTGTGIDFQSTGIAQVEISASGVPMKRGVDIIVMLDMSSSMDKCISCGNDTGIYSSKTDSCSCSNPVTRVDELRTAMQNLKNILVAAPGADDIRIAVADFNGYYQDTNFPNSPYEIDTSDRTQDKSGLTNKSYARVYTGDALDADAFIAPADLDITGYFTKPSGQELTNSGTNYDYAFDAIYQLGNAIQTENEAKGTPERELIVLFMSDGAPNQYNYYHTTGGNSGSTDWNYWLTGRIGDGADEQTFAETVYTEHTYYYDAATGNQHRMANAIKGDPSQTYEIIRKNQNVRTDAVTDLLIPLEATDANYGKENMYKLPGLGAKMYSVAFYVSNDGPITEESAKHVLKNIPTSSEMYIEAEEEGALEKAFTDITADILYAAYNARFVDKMGKDYDLQLKPLKDLYGNALEEQNKIEVVEYDIYTRADYLNGKCTEDQIGDRKGTYKILETVTFNPDGTEAYSNLIDGGQTNILIDGVIRAKNFYYNTSKTDSVKIEGISIPTGVDEHNLTTGSTDMLPAETFYWNMGTVKTTELALRYYVYLTGFMEGTREAGSYPTNEYANLYYDNFVGNPCHKDTVSPVLPWKEANVSYAFYLVDEQGRIVVNQTTSQTGSFANKIAVTNPVVHSTIKLNDEAGIDAAQVAASGVLPEGYTLYDAVYDASGNIVSGATYTVEVNSDGSGSWEITGPKPDNTTYVMQHNPSNTSAYDNTENVDSNTYDYSHTVVWFAVVWKIQALPDTVVVDYGLPVDISVLANDMFGDHGKLAGVGALDTAGLNLDGHTISNVLPNGTFEGQYGEADVISATGKVRYSLKTMEMNSHDRFVYAVDYSGSANAGFYYETVTVIPATTIYYEDSFLTFAKYKADGTADGTWGYDGNAVEGALQGEDRPGEYSLTDANNIYGYDGVNLGMSKYSLGQARMIHVDANSYATASFSFWGTGFDVIGMTSNTTGVISVEVKDAAGTSVKKAVVNTYYGYTVDAEGNWIPAPNVENAIYQVPVIQIEDLLYGHYDVVLTATYLAPVDKTTADGYDLYLDAIRIYDPADDGNGNDVIKNAYIADGEGWPSYIELRNGLIEANSFDGVADEAMNAALEGAVFIDGDGTVANAQISDYIGYGPNNEVYLAPGQSIAFLMSTPENIANVHLGVSLATVGNAATYSITNIARMDSTDGKIETGDDYNSKTYRVDTATDMYYDLSSWKNDIIVISNTGTSGIISITNIKSTYTSDPEEISDIVTPDTQMPLAEGEESTENAVDLRFTRVYMTPAAANVVVEAMNTADEEQTPEEPTVPEETEPEEPTAPEETEPEEPAVFEPELFHVMLSKDQVKVGQKVLVTVTTSADVQYLTINGMKVEQYDQGYTGNRTWKLNVTASAVGTMRVDVICFNENDLASETVTKQVLVLRKGIFDSIGSLFG